jgi:phosphoribosylanthranilate isomerase
MRSPENIRAITALQPDFIGFIFYDKSPRYISPDEARVHGTYIPQSIKKVGVFVNETFEKVGKIANEVSLDLVQLHGDESPEYCKKLRNAIHIIKAFRVKDELNWESIVDYSDVVDYFMFDTATLGYGGSGRSFDWSLLNELKIEKPFFLSGGLGEDNIQDALKVSNQKLYAVDINSRIELEPGIKDEDKFAKIKAMVDEFNKK